MASESCQICGPDPQECPVVLCAPCLMVSTSYADIASSKPEDYSAWSLKRLAWAFGCARKDSDMEIELFLALKARIGSLRP